MKDGYSSSQTTDFLDLYEDLEALAISPPPEVSYLVQRIMYLKLQKLSVADTIRSKILKNSDEIINLFKLCEIIQFAEVETSFSSSNRNFGEEIFTLRKKSKEDICSSAKGRARLNLFRINQDLI